MFTICFDDHPLTNSGLASCLEETGRFSVTCQANTLKEAECIIEESENPPSLIILDILLGEENGLDFLSFLKNFCREKHIPVPPVLVCSVLEDPFRIQTALKLGASGYIPKTGSKTELLKAIDTVLRGDIYITGEHAVKLSKSLGAYEQFTKREMEVLNLIKQNKSNREISKSLCINIRTVENHISNIYFKTGCGSRQELEKL
jgi:NarL family two-component system response regulator LiaR